MNFRGRFDPNIQPDPNETMWIHFNIPRNADGVTLFIKERDTYADTDDRQISEGSDDDLLATFTGRIVNRRFQVITHTNASDDSSLPTIRLGFQDWEEIYEIPVVTQEGEEEGANWELGFTVRYGDGDDAEDVYDSPVGFIPRGIGRLLVVDNSMRDLQTYESHANLVRKRFADKGMEARIIRGRQSRPAVANYSAENTEDFVAGFDYNEFASRAADYDYIYFNCHGDIDLIAGDLWGSPCLLCKNRFSHHAFRKCTRDANDTCLRGDRYGFFFYQMRTEAEYNAVIRLQKPGSESVVWLSDVFSSHTPLTGPFVQWDEYEPEFPLANSEDPNVTQEPDLEMDPSGESVFTKVGVPNNFLFTTLLSFPTNESRPDFREFHLERGEDDSVIQNPASSYLHHSTAQPVPGVPVICFMGERGPLSAQAQAAPTESLGDAPADIVDSFSEEEADAVPIVDDDETDTVPVVDDDDTDAVPIVDDGDTDTVPIVDETADGGEESEETETPGEVDESFAVVSLTPFTSPPSPFQARAYDGVVDLQWSEIEGADRYVIYWTSCPSDEADAHPGVQIGTAEYETVAMFPEFRHTGLTNDHTYFYLVQAQKERRTDLTPERWTNNVGDLSNVKVIYAGCCLTGRKTVFADAVLGSGVKFFIGHQVVTAGVAERLVNQFFRRWLDRGAILRNLIDVYNDLVSAAPGYARTRPIIYYRNAANETRNWHPGETPPDAADIKLD